MEASNSTIFIQGAVSTGGGNINFHGPRQRLSWAPTTEYERKQKDIYSRAVAGTLEWTSDMPTFKDWRVGRGNPLLCCYGCPGGGKTVFTSFIVNKLRALPSGNAVTFFYCDYTDPLSRTAENILVCLLKQLLDQLPPGCGSVGDILEDYEQGGSRPTLQKLIIYLRRLCLAFEQMVFMIIDALDECDQKPRDKIFEALEALGSSKVRMLVTSRSHLWYMFKDCTAIEVRATHVDIRIFLEHKFEKNADLEDIVSGKPYLKYKIIDEISYRAYGMFLGPALQIELISECTTAKEIRKVLGTPASIESYYENSIARITRLPKYRRALAIDVLLWLSHAKRPLTSEELVHCVAIKPGQDSIGESCLSKPGLMIRLCAGLIEFDTGGNTIRLVHETLSTYIKRIGEGKHKEFANAKTRIAEACLTYAQLKELANICESIPDLQDRLNRLPFLAYTARYWGYHASQASDAMESLTSGLFAETGPLRSIIQADRYGQDNFNSDILRFQKSPKPIHLVAGCGWKEAADKLLDDKPDDINVRDDDGKTVLFWAVVGAHEAGSIRKDDWERERDKERHMKMIELLLEKGADANAKDRDGGTPLLEAVRNGQEDIVHALVENNKEKAKGRGGNSGEEEPDSGDPYQHNNDALFFAVRCGQTNILSRLLGWGLNPNVKSGGVTLLYWAVFREDASAIKILLGKGAEIGWEPDGSRVQWMKDVENRLIRIADKSGLDLKKVGVALGRIKLDGNQAGGGGKL